MELTQKELRALLYYSIVTGDFYWKVSRGGRAKAGAKAGTLSNHVNDQPFISIGINYKYYKSHRLAWFYITGEWPEKDINHEDGNSLNNAWHNLGSVTHRQNHQNKNAVKMDNRTVNDSNAVVSVR